MNPRKLENEIRIAFDDGRRSAYQVEIQEVGGDQLCVFVSYFANDRECECEVYVPDYYSPEQIVEELDGDIESREAYGEDGGADHPLGYADEPRVPFSHGAAFGCRCPGCVPVDEPRVDPTVSITEVDGAEIFRGPLAMVIEANPDEAEQLLKLGRTATTVGIGGGAAQAFNVRVVPDLDRAPCSLGCPGWALFDTGDVYEIEKCDACGKYEDDYSAGEVAAPVIERGLELMRDIAQNPLKTIKLLIVDFVPSTDLAELAQATQGWLDDYERGRAEQARQNVRAMLMRQLRDANSAEAPLIQYLIDEFDAE